MSDTIFTNNVTLTDADWFNDVNRLHYTIFGDPGNVSTAFSTVKQTATLVSTGVLFVAGQTAMEAVTSGPYAVVASTQQFHPGHAKAVVRWSSSTTVPFAYNVSSPVVKVGTGNYTIRFLNNFSSSHAIVPVFATDDIGQPLVGSVSTLTISTCTVVFRVSSGALTDAANFYAEFKGDQ